MSDLKEDSAAFIATQILKPQMKQLTTTTSAEHCQAERRPPLPPSC